LDIIKTFGHTETDYGRELKYGGLVTDDQDSIVKTNWSIPLHAIDALIVPSDIH
jgi:glycogen debranching enzyme